MPSILPTVRQSRPRIAGSLFLVPGNPDRSKGSSVSLVGGFVSVRGRMDADPLFQKVRGFAILPGETGSDYRYQFHSGPAGGIFAKYKDTLPPQVYAWQNDRVRLLTLGFHDLEYPQSFDASDDRRSLVDKIQNSEGEFVSILFEPDGNRVSIINDRFAVRAMFIVSVADTIYFCSNLALLTRLVPIRLEPDPLGILQIFSYNHTLTPRTHLSGVERLYPASRVDLENGVIRQTQYWSLRHQPDESLDPAEHARRTVEAFRRGLIKKVRRAPKGFMSLSGGLDSRLVAAVASRECGYFAFTMSNDTDQPDTPDVRVSRRVAARLGVEHRVLPMPHMEISAAIEPVIRLTAGLVPIHHPVKAWQAVKMMCDTTGFKIGGGVGDAIAGNDVLSLYQIEPVWVRTLVRMYASQSRIVSLDALARFLQPEILHAAGPRLEASILESFDRLSGPTAAHRITAWDETQYATGFIFSSPIHNHPDVSEASPALGYEYVDHMLRLPAPWLYKKNFYQYMIHSQFPELRDIEWANTGRPLSGRLEPVSLPFKKRLFRALARPLPFAVLERLWGQVAPPAPSAVGFFPGDDKLFDRLTQILSDLPAARQFFKADACRAFLDNARRGQTTFDDPTREDEMLGTLISLCYWFQFLSE
jgi:hypothetical protein